MSEQNLQGVCAGRRHLTPLQIVYLADITGDDAKVLLALNVIQKAADPVERARLQESFFRRGIAGVVAMCCIFGANDNSNARNPELVKVDNLYIVAHSLLHWLTSRLAVLMATLSTDASRQIYGPREHQPKRAAS